MTKAISLLELLIVIVILGILVSIAIVRYGNLAESARAAVAWSTLSNIIGAEKAYYWDQEPPAYTNNLNLLGFPTQQGNPTSFNDDYFTYSFDTSRNAAFAIRLNKDLGRKSYKMDVNGLKDAQAKDTYW